MIHTVFSTKNREPFLTTSELRSGTYAYLGGVVKTLKCHPIKIGGVADHVHLLTTLARAITVAEFVKELKRVSTNWIQIQEVVQERFHWQAGYAAFSVGRSEIRDVEAYIDSQEEHHQNITFQDEYRRLLREHNVEYDERYLWD